MIEGREHDGSKPGQKRRVCVICGREFMGNPVQKYCSAECRDRGVKDRAHEYYEREIAKNTEERVCPICGGTFKANIRRRQKYCSRECKDRARREKRDVGALKVLLEWSGDVGSSPERAGGDISAVFEGMEDFKGDRISTVNEIARRRGMSYGEIQAERLIEKMKREKEI